MKELRRIAIFLASPGDVSAERAHVRSVVEELNRSVAATNGLHIDVVGWDTDAVPALGGDGQAVINRQIAAMSDYDIFVGIMWNRFGSPTPRAGSGTEEEFDLALAAFQRGGAPQIMLYFGQMPASLESPDQLEQKGRVVAFRSKVEKIGLTWRYDAPDSFREMFRQHLTKWLLALPSPKPPEAAGHDAVASGVAEPIRDQAASRPPAAKAKWVMLGDRFYKADSVRERQGEVAVAISPDGHEEDESLRQVVGRRAYVRFAYLNLAGAAEIVDGERSSDGDRDQWEIKVRLSRQDQAGVFGEFSYNNHTSLDLATMRARLILLDEVPANARDPFLSSMVSGINSADKVERGVLPGLWRSLGGEIDAFLPLARLLSVYYLKSTGTVEQILKLEIGPVVTGSVQIEFEGVRSKIYANRDPEKIAFVGACPLG